jgi:hypothetical protein
MDDHRFNGKKIYKFMGGAALYEIRQKHIHDVTTKRLEYEIRGKHIHKVNKYQPEFEIRGHYIHLVNSTAQPVYEIR